LYFTYEFSAKTLSRHSGESRNPEDGRETLDCRVKPGNDEERSAQNRLFAVDSPILKKSFRFQVKTKPRSNPVLPQRPQRILIIDL
jgi:hypothetical protein